VGLLQVSIVKYVLILDLNYKILSNIKTIMPLYTIQFKISEAHQLFIEQSFDKCLKLGVVKCANSLHNSPISCVPKIQGQGLSIVQDFCKLNNHLFFH